MADSYQPVTTRQEYYSDSYTAEPPRTVSCTLMTPSTSAESFSSGYSPASLVPQDAKPPTGIQYQRLAYDPTLPYAGGNAFVPPSVVYQQYHQFSVPQPEPESLAGPWTESLPYAQEYCFIDGTQLSLCPTLPQCPPFVDPRKQLQMAYPVHSPYQYTGYEPVSPSSTYCSSVSGGVSLGSILSSNADEDEVRSVTSSSSSSSSDSDSFSTPGMSDDVDVASPDAPYAQLIFKALKDAPGHKMDLQDIYNWFEKHTRKIKPGSKGWQNSIRHNLSMNAVSSIFCLGLEYVLMSCRHSKAST